MGRRNRVKLPEIVSVRSGELSSSSRKRFERFYERLKETEFERGAVKTLQVKNTSPPSTEPTEEQPVVPLPTVPKVEVPTLEIDEEEEEEEQEEAAVVEEVVLDAPKEKPPAKATRKPPAASDSVKVPHLSPPRNMSTPGLAPPGTVAPPPSVRPPPQGQPPIQQIGAKPLEPAPPPDQNPVVQPSPAPSPPPSPPQGQTPIQQPATPPPPTILGQPEPPSGIPMGAVVTIQSVRKKGDKKEAKVNDQWLPIEEERENPVVGRDIKVLGQWYNIKPKGSEDPVTPPPSAPLGGPGPGRIDMQPPKQCPKCKDVWQENMTFCPRCKIELAVNPDYKGEISATDIQEAIPRERK